jgi:alpha-1,3-glucosyltransferase
MALELASPKSSSSPGFTFAGGEYLFLSTTAHYTIAPLLFQPREWPIKAAVMVLGFMVAWGVLACVNSTRGDGRPLLGCVQLAFLFLGLPALELYCVAGHEAMFGPGRMEFLPLMATSVYCAAGVAFVWAVQTAGYCGVDVSRAYNWP